MTDLKEIFAPDVKDKHKGLSGHYKEALELETSPINELSPGVVVNDELIARQVHTPIHYDEDTNTLTPSALADVFNKGLSTDRLAYTTAEAFHAAGDAKVAADRKAKGTDQEYLGYVAAEVGLIRSLQDETEHDPETELKQVFGVYDSALPNWHTHADVLLLKSKKGEGKGPRKLKRQEMLTKAFGELVRK